MNIDIVCVGRLKESFFKEAVKEYEKRLSRYAKLSVIEVADEPTKENASENECDIVKKKEADRLLKAVKNDGYVISLDIKGKSLTSKGLADKLEGLAVSGTGRIQFVIGGSLGLHRSVIEASDLVLSFSQFTFPHQLMRVILLEQIYRSFKIIKNEPYDK